jgi:benzoyl-CoA reductase/2-hydroxyglutaryl-CoA dehydratase subunit BcrC/BadD/HgdB
MTTKAEPIFDDAYVGEPPAKRALAYIEQQRNLGKHVVGAYCGYAPVELMMAHDIVPAVLCAFSNSTIETAEATLPANLCPLIKSSYGFIEQDTCPFYWASEAVIGETTCDGKKKMFELIASRKPLHVMDLPQLCTEPQALDSWTGMIKKLQDFLETTFNVRVDDEAVESAIRENNEKNAIVMEMLDHAALENPVLGWAEMLDIVFFATPGRGKLINDTLRKGLDVLHSRVKNGYVHGRPGAPRILITGCPTAGDSAKIYKIIEAAGGVIVALDSCTGMKPFYEKVAENTGDPLRAIAERYLKIPCACMSPNIKRLEELDRMIAKYKPQAVIDIVLHACHGYNIESFKVGQHIESKHSLPFLKIVTDYSQGDIGQLTTRIEGLLESIDNFDVSIF